MCETDQLRQLFPKSSRGRSQILDRYNDIIIYLTVRFFLQPTASFQDELRLFHAKKPENMGGN